MSLLPTKYVDARRSVLGRSATLLECRRPNQTVSELWMAVRHESDSINFGEYSEALTLLFLLGAVDLDRGKLVWDVDK
ncbi:ABC-three component system middle component 6 [Isoptericola sp. NPDC019693]|uniref:ABC-three component system middle component 6 n=1 Tax=Isoptericola sp. NPDC019693 TaxID=3364009 RepID=UPI003791C2D2